MPTLYAGETFRSALLHVPLCFMESMAETAQAVKGSRWPTASATFMSLQLAGSSGQHKAHSVRQAPEQAAEGHHTPSTLGQSLPCMDTEGLTLSRGGHRCGCRLACALAAAIELLPLTGAFVLLPAPRADPLQPACCRLQIKFTDRYPLEPPEVRL